MIDFPSQWSKHQTSEETVFCPVHVSVQLFLQLSIDIRIGKDNCVLSRFEMFMPKYTSIIMTFSNYSMENFHSFNFHYAALLVKIFMALCREKKD